MLFRKLVVILLNLKLRQAKLISNLEVSFCWCLSNRAWFRTRDVLIFYFFFLHLSTLESSEPTGKFATVVVVNRSPSSLAMR